MNFFYIRGRSHSWEYDGEADTLYISFGKPKRALGVDLGKGVIVRYDEKAREVVGLTLIGVGKRWKNISKIIREMVQQELVARVDLRPTST